MTTQLIRHLVFAGCVGVLGAQAAVNARQQHNDGVALGIATYQTTCPVALRGYLATAGTFLYQSAKVENRSDKPIAQLTFGVLVADATGSQPATLLRSAVDVSLQPDVTQDANVNLLRPVQLEELSRAMSGTPTVTLGVIALRWTDGTKWVVELPEGAKDFSSGTGHIIAQE